MGQETKKRSSKSKPTASKANTLSVTAKPGETVQRAITESGLSPIVRNTVTERTFAKGTCGELDISECVNVMIERAQRVKSGDLGELEATMTAQAASLDAIFNDLARRSFLNIGEYMGAAETYMRLALKAQGQCRATIETLAMIKNPPVVYARQANISNGPQQVNNGVPTHTREIESEQNKLSEGGNELLTDARTPGLARRSDQAVETLGEINRTEDLRRKG